MSNKSFLPNRTYIVASITPGNALGTASGASIASSPKVHLTAQSAKNEAMRLAAANPGKQFTVLQACGTATVDPAPQPPVQWN